MIDRLGGGGMGDVYSAWDEELRRRVALKVIRDHIGPERRAAVLQEARALARLRDPHVVGVHDVGQVDDAVFVSMDLLEGKNLREWVEAARPPWSQRVEIILQCARGLWAAHESGLVHHDVKPSNVVVEIRDEQPWATLIDFGLAADASGSSEVRGGTIAYMAPERRDGGPGDAASDQWSLALMATELLSGSRPSLDAALAGDLGACGAAAPVLRRALRRDPSQRYRDVESFSRAVRSATRSRSWRRLAVVAVALAASVGVALWGAKEAPCDEQARAWVDANASSPRVAAALGRLATDAATLASPMRDQVEAWQEAWTGELTAACTGGERPGPTCRDAQIEQWVATLDALVGPSTGPEGRWGILAEAGRLVAPCSEANEEISEGEARVRALEVALRHSEALGVAHEMLSSVPPRSNARARMLSRMSTLQRRMDDLETSLRLADEAMLLAAKIGDHRVVARTAIDRVHTLVTQGELSRAEDAVRVARSLVAAADDAPELLAGLLGARAYVHEIRFRMSDALADYAEALEIKRQIAPGSVHEAKSLEALGYALGRAGDCEAAVERVWAAIDVFRALFGPETPWEGEALQTIARCQAQAGDDEAAVATSEKSAEILGAALGHQSLERGLALEDLGDILVGIGRDADARTPYVESARIKRAVLGPNHVETLLAEVHLGWYLVSLGDLEPGRRYLDSALESAASAPNLEGVEWAQIEAARAALLEAEGDLEGAFMAQRKSVEHHRTALADMPRLWVEPLMNLASLEARLGRLEQARSTYAEARQVAVGLPGASVEKLVARIDEAVGALAPAGTD
ncbi:MAG: serine/threonine-protein kinase [Myxococcota bacterium]